MAKGDDIAVEIADRELAIAVEVAIERLVGDLRATILEFGEQPIRVLHPHMGVPRFSVAAVGTDAGLVRDLTKHDDEIIPVRHAKMRRLAPKLLAGEAKHVAVI